MVFWRAIHLVAAAYWLGGLISLAVTAGVAGRTLDRDGFRKVMRAAGRSFFAGSAVAWVLLALSGLQLAREHGVTSAAQLGSGLWGQTLEAKIWLSVAAVALTALHSYSGSRTESRGLVIASRVIAPVILLVTLAIFVLAARLAEL